MSLCLLVKHRKEPVWMCGTLSFIRASATHDSITELIQSDHAALLHGRWINLVTIPCNRASALNKKQLRFSTRWENKKIGPFHSPCESHHSRQAHSGRCLCLYSPAVVSHPQILMRFLLLCFKGRKGSSNRTHSRILPRLRSKKSSGTEKRNCHD